MHIIIINVHKACMLLITKLSNKIQQKLKVENKTFTTKHFYLFCVFQYKLNFEYFYSNI